MPDLWMDVDVALSEVPVNILPLIDDTDFKTREEAIAYDAAGMDLAWNFVTTAGAYTQTEVTPTTGGNYDWSHQGNGMYSIEIPASGGASINNDTEGFGWFSGVCTGVLPWRGPIIGFRSAAINNSLIDGGDYLQVDAVQVEGLDATDNIADAVWDEIITGHLSASTTGAALNGDPWAAPPSVPPAAPTLGFTFSNHARYMIATKKIDFDTDTIRLVLCKQGFEFDADTRAMYTLNMNATTGSLSITFDSTAKTLTRSSGSFISDGFVVGNLIETTSANNPGPFTVTAVAALVLTVEEAITSETVSTTVTAEDELPTGFGYTHNSIALAGSTVTEDDTADAGKVVFSTITITASGGSIGPTPGAIIYDDTTTDDTIIGYLNFGGDQTIVSGMSFPITSLTLLLS